MPPREAEQPSAAGLSPTTRTQGCQPQPKPTKVAARENFWDLPSNLVIVEAKHPSVLDIHRSFDFLMADPDLSQYQKPMDRLSTDTQRFIVELYSTTPERSYSRRTTTSHDRRRSGQTSSSYVRRGFY